MESLPFAYKFFKLLALGQFRFGLCRPPIQGGRFKERQRGKVQTGLTFPAV
jgi:hypothetical protein